MSSGPAGDAALGLAANATPLKHVIMLIEDAWLGFGWNTADLTVVLATLVVAEVASGHWLRWD
jgi:hypothetical protein